MSTLQFMIEDAQKTVDRTLLRSGAQATLQIAKTADFFSSADSWAFVGYIDFPTPVRQATNMNDISVNCFEAKKGIYDTRIVYARSAPLSILNDPKSQKSMDYTARRHARRILNDRHNTVLEDQSIKDRWGINEDGISTNLSVIIPNLVYNYDNAGNALDDIATKIGAFWTMDYRSGLKKVKMDYPQGNRVPIVIKNGPANVNLGLGDNPKRTAYIVEGFDVPSTSSVSSGHAIRLFGITRIDRHIVSKQGDTKAFTSLTNKAIGQPFTTRETKFNGINFVVSKRGTVESPNNRINGAIFTTKTENSILVPDSKLMEWHVPLNDIETTKTNVTVNLDDIRTRFIDANVTFIVVWYQRSGTDGDPNTDENNTILLYRDTNTDGNSIIAAGGDRDAQLTWKAHGPTYALNVTSALNRLFAVTNYTEAAKIGFIEPEPQDLSSTESINLNTRYLSNLLYLTSLYKSEPRFRVTNPDDFVFRPYQTVRVQDSLAFPSGFDLEIHDVEYDFSSNTNEVSIGGVTYIDDGWPTNWPCATLA